MSAVVEFPSRPSFWFLPPADDAVLSFDDESCELSPSTFAKTMNMSANAAVGNPHLLTIERVVASRPR